MTFDVAIMVFEMMLMTVALNLPFGYWRAPTKKFSFMWFFYIHIPIPAIIVMRTLAGFGVGVVPFMIAAAVLGQIIGARLNRNVPRMPARG